MNAYELYKTDFFSEKRVQKIFTEWKGAPKGLVGRTLIGQKEGGEGWFTGLATSPDCDIILLAIGQELSHQIPELARIDPKQQQCAAIFLIAGRIPRLMTGNRIAAGDKEAGGKGYGHLPFRTEFRKAFEAGFRAGWDLKDFRLGITNSSKGGKPGGEWYDWADSLCRTAENNDSAKNVSIDILSSPNPNRKTADNEQNQDALDQLEQKELALILSNSTLDATEKQQLIKSRRGQGIFRDKLFNYWKSSCCITYCKFPSVLRASHIKPWSESSNQERLDVFNGLLLNPNADVLFDQGFITFTDSGKMLVSPQIESTVLITLLGKDNAMINVDENHAKYLAYHREHRFRSTTT